MFWLSLLTAIQLFAYNANEVNVTGHELPTELESVGVDEKNSKKYDKKYDGTDMRAWWD